ncbi:MAG: xanthine dehydrogenase family protein, partial [Planctomycetota bacterium]|nr:xanthine dehydrogenase family protein [Planctomycetota bacterium]
MPRRVTYKVGLVGFEAEAASVEGTVREITVDVHELDASPWGADTKLTYVGTEIPRVDGPAKATGAAKYTYDVQPPGLVFAGVVYAPHAHARVASVDAAAARALPGVLEVRTFEGTRVTFPGAIVAAVCAENERVLEDALAAVLVTYESQPTAAVTEDAMAAGAPVVDPRRTSNVASTNRQPPPDTSAVFADAEHVTKATYRTAVQTHSCLEPHGCTVMLDAEGGATVWASTQATAGFASRRFAEALGLPMTRIRVLTEHMGGGFGSKFGALEWDILCAEFARSTKRPVRMMLSRRLEHLVGGNRPDSIQELELAATKDGRFVGLRGQSHGTYGNAASGGAGAANSAVYRFPTVEMHEFAVATFSARGAAFRAPRHPQGFFALESLIDRYASEVGLDALAVRLQNDPHPIRQVQWRLGAERIGWAQNRRPKAGGDPGVVKRGVGCAASRWSQAGRHMGMGGALKVNAHVARDGSVAIECCVQDLGTGTRTLMAILAAEELGIPPSRIEARLGDTRYPPGPGSGGSTTA